MDIKSSKTLTLSEVNDMLLKRQKDSELGYEQVETLAYCEKFVKIDAKAAQKLLNALIKENEKISHDAAVRIVDIMPKKIDTLKAVLMKDKIELNEEELNGVLTLLQ